MPPEQQEERLKALPHPKRRLPGLLASLAGDLDEWVKVSRRFHTTQALLRCAATALAAERYRLAHRRWPEDLTALVPAYLDTTPTDPFAGRPLRLRRLPDGLVVYSLGPDRVDDSGKLDRTGTPEPGFDVGFQLWGIDQRRGPPRTE